MAVRRRLLRLLALMLAGVILTPGSAISQQADEAQAAAIIEPVDVVLSELQHLTATIDSASSLTATELSGLGLDVPVVSDAPLLTLSQLIEEAVAYSPGLTALGWQAYASFQQAESIAGYGRLASSFSVLGTYTDSPLGNFAGRLNAGRITQLDFDPATLNNPDYYGSLEYKLKLMYPLFDSGRVRLLADAVAFNGEAIDHEALRAEHELIAQVVELYLNHALLSEQLVVVGEALSTVEELHRLINSLEREGLVTYSDVAAAEVELANIRDEQNKATERLAALEQALAIMTGREELHFTSVVPIPAELMPLAREEATSLALEYRPDLIAMDRRVCAATNVLNEAIKQRNPTVGLFAETAHTSADSWAAGHTATTVGAQLLLDLDTGGVIAKDIEQKRADLQAALFGYDQLVDMVSIEITQAHAELRIAKSSITTFSAQENRARENLRVVRNRYEAGLTNFLDLRMAVTMHLESGLREVKSHHDLLLAYLDLLLASGLIESDYDPFFITEEELGGSDA